MHTAAARDERAALSIQNEVRPTCRHPTNAEQPASIAAASSCARARLRLRS
jgi:hypothetical protein